MVDENKKRCNDCVFLERAGNAYPCMNCSHDGSEFRSKCTDMITMPVGFYTSPNKNPVNTPEAGEIWMVQDGQQIGSIQMQPKQVGGDHYNFPIQPIEYIVANELGYREGNVIKYVTRHKRKNGKQDIEKAIHYLEMILESYEEDERHGEIAADFE